MILSLLFILCLIIYVAAKFASITSDELYEDLKRRKGEEYARNLVALRIAKKQLNEENKKKFKWQSITHWTWKSLIKKRAKEIASVKNFEEVYIYSDEPVKDVLIKNGENVRVIVTMTDDTLVDYEVTKLEADILSSKLVDGAQFIQVGKEVIPSKEIKSLKMEDI